MKTFTYNITDYTLFDIIDDNDIKEINNAKSILIQVFSGEDEKKVTNILHDVKTAFPAAKIITSSTDGEINQDEITTCNTVVSISTFLETTINVAHAQEDTSFQTGVALANKLIEKNTKLIIAFGDGLTCNGEEFLNGIYSVNPEITVAGGLSADNAKFVQCFIGMDEKIYNRGAVAVALNSETLLVNNYYHFGWREIGLKHKITKAIKNRLYMIDDITAVEFYAKYLGKEIAKDLPATGIEFPLIINRGTFKKARAVTVKHEDGSLSFAGNIPQGEYVHIGIARIGTLLSTNIHKIQQMHAESFFIYSCMARRRFIPKFIYKEITPFANLASTCGFFTYGEFFTDKKHELLNQTITAVSLCEIQNKKPVQQNNLIAQSEEKKQDATYKVLTNIIDVKSKELEKQTLILEQISQELDAKNTTLETIQEMSNLGSWELDLKTMKISWSKMSYIIYNKDPQEGPPSYSEFINMVLPEDRKRLIKAQKNLEDGKIHSLEIKVRRNDGKILTILESAKLVYENKKPVKIIGMSLDLTKIKMQDSILMQQSKHAQMGEMVSMIAHQWRQPLNAISASAIKLTMLSEMQRLTHDDVQTIAKFIEDMTQKMSQTINDFINFTNPTNTKELINFHDMLKEIYTLIGTQLANHNISTDITIQPNITLYGYKKELEHVLLNIITNAKDALEVLDNPQKNIKIAIYTKNTLCIIKISDNAGGIKKEHLERVFCPYFTTKDANKGTGLGLYMSRKIVREHFNGDIYVRNKSGGAEFTIILEGYHEE